MGAEQADGFVNLALPSKRASQLSQPLPLADVGV